MDEIVNNAAEAARAQQSETAGVPVHALEDLSSGKQCLEAWVEFQQETFGCTLAGQLEVELSLELFSIRTVWEVVEEIEETSLSEVTR